MEIIEVKVTIDDQNKAEKLCEIIISERLAACAQISNEIISIYHWQNKIERAKEYYCIFKTRIDLYTQLEKRIKDLHHYDTPEIIAVNISNVLPAYKDWVISETKK